MIVSSFFGLEKVQQRLEQTSLESEKRDEVALKSWVRVEELPITGSGA